MKKKIILIVFSIAFIIGTLLTVVNYCCFDYSFYEKEYSKIKVAENIGCSFEDLMDATKIILDYTQDKRNDMVAIETVNNVEREFYNDREKAHMIDVKDLYLKAMLVRNICVIIVIACIGYALFKKLNVYFSLSEIYNKVSVVFLFIVSILGLYAACDFNSFWINFHHVFFTKNDFWLLNPRTDLLINMVPEQFFFDLVTKIIVIFLVVFITTNILALFYRKKSVSND